ncbi:hypothetical protein DM02DRAFT_360164 [Periconia macrospinosa]|uniref:Secreted protein n=1 Tax=Periconia macrospinosa TaxID=97972 RepID=A0A2V1DVR4_9PLEO|nr:hypothetical protein DM02DRAFT_360164 [Periconia macrospinosa]
MTRTGALTPMITLVGTVLPLLSFGGGCPDCFSLSGEVDGLLLLVVDEEVLDVVGDEDADEDEDEEEDGPAIPFPTQHETLLNFVNLVIQFKEQVNR